jgi:hypothetical protein
MSAHVAQRLKPAFLHPIYGTIELPSASQARLKDRLRPFKTNAESFSASFEFRALTLLSSCT